MVVKEIAGVLNSLITTEGSSRVLYVGHWTGSTPEDGSRTLMWVIWATARLIIITLLWNPKCTARAHDQQS